MNFKSKVAAYSYTISLLNKIKQQNNSADLLIQNCIENIRLDKKALFAAYTDSNDRAKHGA
ncbi:hypothetical protein BN59_00687 [Legionella massiliensis]|uniref:Uncharacterized protein n=1 Tax=Legionella massiliensis TaxID=1034943 RepID=A0A078KXJ4_9GAMM|nr:hypothetical protein [Legionella massiliensis]CDZ76418.1 hypothetical protein BN59_00687 [Legionella massiliensis]CEE12156.1 hypothetical protein BN1094_00687 [Legionella massiliensis]